MRVFPDTNVLLSALPGRGLCRDLLDLVIERHTLVVSEQVLSERERHLRGKLRVPPPERRAFAALLREVGVVVPEADPPPGVSVPDPDDGPIVGAALAAGAALLVTGDTALLDMAAPRGLDVCSPRNAWLRLRGAWDRGRTTGRGPSR